MKILSKIDEIKAALQSSGFFETDRFRDPSPVNSDKSFIAPQGRLRENRSTALIGLVPTMGALHAGHLSLIEKSVKENDITVVSIFVNPTQFGPNEDFDKYPRTLEADAEICEKAGVNYIFAPSVSEMYDDTRNTTLICPQYTDVDKLCGKSRPGHFDGVATVVAKLFNIVKPDNAYFGKKDAQQLFIIKKMVRDLNFDINIVPMPIVREADGLALSSRNAYLTSDARKEALKISLALKKVRELFKAGTNDYNTLQDTVLAYLDEEKIEYFEIADANSFDIYENTDIINPNSIALIAAKIDGVRLIDNMDLE